MAKEVIIQKMKDSGCRITKQRMILLDIILEEDCSYIGDKNILCAFMFLFRMNSTKKAETYVDAFFCYFIGNCSLQ